MCGLFNIPPENSRYAFDEIELEFHILQKDFSNIRFGDFNSRTGILPDYYISRETDKMIVKFCFCEHFSDTQELNLLNIQKR